MEALLSLFILFLMATAVIYWLPGIVWWLAPFFRMLNILHWFLYNPLRFVHRRKDSSLSRIAHYLLRPAYLLYWLILYFCLFPLRLISSFYYNVLLFFSVNLRDTISDFFKPTQLQTYRGWRYYWRWLFGLPVRFFRLVFRNSGLIIQSLSMFVLDLVWPAWTMYHGTDFQQASLPILKGGKWRVGNGDFAGLGLYFAINRRVAMHYAGGRQPTVIVSRISIGIIRPITSLQKEVRIYAGTSGRGQLIAERAGRYTTFLEHYRQDHGGWWEYCMVKPGQRNQYVTSWRIRPICVLGVDKNRGRFAGHPKRIPNGVAFWPNSVAAFILVMVTLFLLYYKVMFIGAMLSG